MLDVSCDLSTSPWILTSCMEMNFWFLDFGKEVYIETGRQYLNQIIHYVFSRCFLILFISALIA